MRARKREISEKYKSFRLQPDSLYSSRLIKTFFNKFIKKGEKALSRKHILSALTRYRSSIRRPQLFFGLLRLFYRLRVQFILGQRRQGRVMLNVPIPVKRNKRDVLNLQTLYRAISDRRERSLSERIQLELSDLTFQPRQSTTMRARNAHLTKVYEERVYMEKRWK
jgi:small subunit ribosomal protein S7